MAKTTTVTNGTPGTHKSNGSIGTSFSFDSGNGDNRGPKRPMAHIDDLTDVTIDIDHYNTSLDTLLSRAENLMKSAESFKTFGRIDLALKNYFEASTVLLEMVPRNKSYPFMQQEKHTQHTRFMRLLQQVKANDPVFEQIKLAIKADNVKSGVQPTVGRRGAAPAASSGDSEDASLSGNKDSRPSHSRMLSNEGTRTSAASPSPPKARPSVRPKPQSLHGNAIVPGTGGSPKVAEDLTARFAKLRSAKPIVPSPGVQDPRIRTQIIIPPPHPMERRDTSTMRRTSLAADDSMPDLPQVPSAIYKPARGTISSEASELPSSATGRFSVTRTTSTTSIKSPPLSASFTALDTPNSQLAEDTGPAKPTIPGGETISVTDLIRLMKAGSKSVSILLIDIRSREEFEEGHIMSQATICIEPEVLQRKDISASDIADSMVLTSSAEESYFERRHEFDLIVFYDQDSPHISARRQTPAEKAVDGLYNALAHFDWDGGKAPKPPKLLEGGLDAWISVMGPSLATKSSAYTSSGRHSTQKSLGAFVHKPQARRKSYLAKPIQDPEEARRWEETLSGPEAFTPVREVDSFLRRFPPASAIKESMVSPILPQAVDATVSTPIQRPALPNHQDAFHPFPPEPTRPAPTVTRPSYSGLAETGEREELMLRSQGNSKKKGRQLVGLRNPGNLCYANSALQALFGTSGFAEDVSSGEWQHLYKVPMKKDESIKQPQLLLKMLSQLFAWMDKGMIHPMEARTLMQYVRHINGKDPSGRPKPEAQVFGGRAQQDAQEFFSFIIDQLHDETNLHRDRLDEVGEPTTIKDNDPKSVLYNAIRYWFEYSAVNDSIITRYWRGLQVSSSNCPSCGARTQNFQAFDIYTCEIQGTKPSIERSFADSTKLETPADFKCDNCKLMGCRQRKTSFARLPDRLAVVISRFYMDIDDMGHTTTRKRLTRVTFPTQGWDVGPYALPAEDRTFDHEDVEVAKQASTDHHYRGPFIYDAYAVICHVGNDVASGHYIAYVRDQSSNDPTDWIKYNDERVKKVKIGSNDPDDETEKMYKDGRQTAYLVFYQRRGT